MKSNTNTISALQAILKRLDAASLDLKEYNEYEYSRTIDSVQKELEIVADELSDLIVKIRGET